MTQEKSLGHAAALLLVGALGTSPVLAAGASVDSATKAQLKDATAYYDRGVEAMDAEKLADALVHFRRSYDTVASPNSRMMVGRALIKLGRLPEAYRELSQTLKQASELAASQKKYKKTVETVQKEIDEIKDKLAYVTVRQGTQLQLQGETIASSNWLEPQPVMPGTVAVEITFANGRKFTKQLTLKAGERSELAMDPPPAAADAAQAATANSQGTPVVATNPHVTSDLNRRTVGYVVGAVGIVGVGAFVGLSLILAPSYGNSKAGCTAQGCPESGIDNETPKATLRGIGYAGLGVGIVGLGVGTWLILSGGSKSAPTTALQVNPSGVQLTHRF